MANEIVFDVYKNTLKCAGGLAPVSGEFAYSEIVCRFDADDEDWRDIKNVTFGFFVTAKKTVGAFATKSDNKASTALPSSLIKGYSEVYVGIVGTFDGKTIATNVVKIDVKRGIVTDNMEGVAETESLYQEIISAFNDGLAQKADKTSVYTKSETDDALASKADAATTAAALAAKANTADVMKYVYVETGSVDDCTQPNTVYNVWIESGIVTSDRALVFCEQTHAKSKLVQYALTRSDFIIFRNWSNDTWDAWDYIPTHSKMNSEIRLAVIRKAIGIEADKTLDVHNASIALYMSTADYSASDYTTTNLPISLSTSADKPNTTSVSIPNGGVSIKIQDTQSNAEWSESVSGSNHVIQNLIPNRTYLYNVLNAAGSVLASGVCKTTGQVRMINGKGNTFNIRDIGGWKCFDGSSECGKIKYGKMYRGARLNGATGGKPAVSLNNNQVAYFKDVLGIRDEIDLRGNTDTAQINDTALGIGVDYVRINIAYYQYSLHDAQNPENTSRYASIIKRIAKDIKENKPIYLHCASGADRTAQVCALVEAICGVRQTDIDRDYELTWFSCETDGSRLDTRRRNYTSSDGGGDWNKFINGSHITGVEDINGITEMEGSSFNDKVVRYLLRAGVTIDEINTIRFGLIEGSPAKLVSPYGSVTISKTLNHISIDNPLTAVEKYQPYEAKITVDNFYKVSQFSITMGGVDCTTQCYQSGKIYIPRVTGNIVISGSAIKPSTVEDFGITDVYTQQEADKTIADTIDATIIEDITIDNIVDQQYNPEGHLMMYYIGSDNVRHNMFDFSTLPTSKGDKGDKGDTGADGYSPTVIVSKSGSVVTISVTDKNGTTSKTVSDGAKGVKGDKGDKGDTGAAGADWVPTAAEKTAIAAEAAGMVSVPTKTSELTNDSGFITSAAISGKADKSEIPTKTSELTNDSGFLTANAAAVNGNLPVEFMPHVGLINASDLSLYSVSSLGNYHAEIAVTPGEKYIINCRSVNSTYPGAFYTLNGAKVSAIFEDSGVTHLNAEITVPDGVDTLWLNNNRNQIALNEWVVYKILTSGEYTEDNNDEIRTLNAERSDEAVESMRRLKNLEALFSFRWKPFDKAYYCFVNDGSKNWVNIFYDVFHAHGVPFCAATVGENIELQYDPQNNGRTVKETLDLIVADGGEVMVYLNAAALKSTDPFELWYEYAVKNGKRLIESYGYKPRGLILSMNSARNSAVGQEICERFFDYADQVGTKPQYNIRRQQFSNTSTVDDVKAYIDSTANSPGFYPIMMHGTYMEPWASAEGMEEILSYIENNYPSTAAVSTYSHVFDTFGTNGFLTLNDLPIYNGGVV